MKALLITLFLALGGTAMAQDNGVIEIVTMELAEGVSAEAFEPVDAEPPLQTESGPLW